MNCLRCGESGFIIRMKVIEIGYDVTQCGKCHACWIEGTTAPIFDRFSALLKSHGYQYGNVEIEGVRAVCQMCDGSGEIYNIKVPSKDVILKVCGRCNACWTPDQHCTFPTTKTLSNFLKQNNLGDKDIINEGKKILCPCCGGQGEIYKAKIADLNLELGICDECDTYWTSDQHITSKEYKGLESILKENGLKYEQLTIERCWQKNHRILLSFRA